MLLSQDSHRHRERKHALIGPHGWRALAPPSSQGPRYALPWLLGSGLQPLTTFPVLPHPTPWPCRALLRNPLGRLTCGHTLLPLVKA